VSHLFRRGAVPGTIVALLALTLAGCSGGGTGSPKSGEAASTSSAPGPASPSGSTGSAGSAGISGSVPSTEAAGSSCAGGSGAISVSSAKELKKALSGARPGQEIVLAPGTYDGTFTVTASGTSAAPVTLCGPRSAILNGGSTSRGYTFYLNHASYWQLKGFTVTGGQKGVITDGSDYDLIYGLYVHSTGDEGIHLRSFSSHDTISHNLVSGTGLHEQFFGEGIYVGSAHKNWCRYSHCQPDASNDDVIAGNTISNTTAENIDIKEGTTGGKITGNHFDGTGMVESAATGWINVKGNDWTISDNTGVNGDKNGFQVHQVYPGWGIGNVFRGNDAQVNGPGYGYYVQNKRLQTIVACNNKVNGAAKGLSTIDCTPL
jgi:hypothetical protein